MGGGGLTGGRRVRGHGGRGRECRPPRAVDRIGFGPAQRGPHPSRRRAVQAARGPHGPLGSRHRDPLRTPGPKPPILKIVGCRGGLAMAQELREGTHVPHGQDKVADGRAGQGDRSAPAAPAASRRVRAGTALAGMPMGDVRGRVDDAGGRDVAGKDDPLHGAPGTGPREAGRTGPESSARPSGHRAGKPPPCPTTLIQALRFTSTQKYFKTRCPYPSAGTSETALGACIKQA